MALLVDGLGVLHAGDEARCVMVAQVLAHACQRVLHRNAQRPQQRRRPDARDLQQLRRVHRAAAQDHFLGGPHFHRYAVAAALAIADADRALALEHDLARVGVGAHGEGRPFHRRMQEGAGRAHAPALLDHALNVAHARLHRAVVVAVARDPHRHRARDEGLAQRIAPIQVGDGQVALAAAEGCIDRTGLVGDALLGPPEIGQHVGIAPAVIAALRPTVEIHALAAIVDMAVDRAGAAQRLAARGGDAPAPGPFAGFRRVEPVHARIDQRVHEAGRDMDEGMPVAGAGFQHADGRPAVLAQPVGQNTAGRAGAHDYIVEGFHAPALARCSSPRLEPRPAGQAVSRVSAGMRRLRCRWQKGFTRESQSLTTLPLQKTPNIYGMIPSGRFSPGRTRRSSSSGSTMPATSPSRSGTRGSGSSERSISLFCRWSGLRVGSLIVASRLVCRVNAPRQPSLPGPTEVRLC